MHSFDYQGVDREGKRVKGSFDALNEGDVRMRLRAEGVRPVAITQTGALHSKFRGLFATRRIPQRGLELFTKQLYLLIGSRISVLNALDMMSEMYADESLGVILSDVKERMQQGVSFEDALNAQGELFPRFYIRLICSALHEEGSSEKIMDQAPMSVQFALGMDRLIKYFEQERLWAQQVNRAVLGWGSVMLGSLFIFPAIFLYVLGDFFGIQLQESQTLHRIVTPIFLFLATASYLFFRYLSLPEGREMRDRLWMKLPVMSAMARGWTVVQFARLMQLLLSSGVSLLDALDLAHHELGIRVSSHMMGSGWFQGSARFKREVEEGRSLAFLLGKTKLFSRAMLQIIAAGETHGSLDHAFGQVAKFQENDCILQFRRASPVRFL